MVAGRDRNIFKNAEKNSQIFKILFSFDTRFWKNRNKIPLAVGSVHRVRNVLVDFTYPLWMVTFILEYFFFLEENT